jgi:hypothetical protein
MLGPAALTVAWMRMLARREERARRRTGGRAARFGAPAVIRELWMVELIDGSWRLDATTSVVAPPTAAGPHAPPVVPSPWSAASSAADDPPGEP